MAFPGGFDVETLRNGLCAYVAGDPRQGVPLVLLHGYPQTALMWAPVAEGLAQGRCVIAFDLPGYGGSAPAPDASKRAMARMIADGCTELGAERFDLAGHDRGGRVGYRLALDMPDRVARLAVLDILPTVEYWDAVDRAFMLRVYHWGFLAQPAPLPERMIGAAPDYYIDWTLQSWTAARSLACFAQDALESYRDNARDPRRCSAMCDDYRAGAGVDVDHDAADRAAGRRLAMPTLALWGAAGIAGDAGSPLDVWRRWAVDLRGEGIAGAGHFLVEEAPGATGAALEKFFA